MRPLTRLRLASYREVQQLTLGSWSGFRRYVLVVGPPLAVCFALFRHPLLGSAVGLAGCVAYYLVACRVLAAEPPPPTGPEGSEPWG